MEEEEQPIAKRKKCMTGKEVIERLESNQNDVKRTVGEIVEELCPFDVGDEVALNIEDKVERLERVTKLLEMKVHKLKKAVKQRHTPEEPMISCSQ